MPEPHVPSLRLNTGYSIPQLGFGVFEIPPAQTEESVTIALDAGYRHLDTAALYGNEREVGAGLARSGIPRESVFVTTKVWPSEFERDATLRAFEESLAKLQLEYLDLYLLHWPAPGRGLYPEAWLTLIDLLRDERIRSIGVSNFEPEHLDRLAELSDVVPAVNQVELHPYLQQRRLREVGNERGIVTEAWSPLAQGEVLDDEVLVEIAARHDVDVARVVLAWSLQLGNVVLSRSVNPDRIRRNLEAVELTLSDAEVTAIDALDCGKRVGPDPKTFDG